MPVRPTGGSPPQLPSLDVDNRNGGAASASLRGHQYNKVPEIANQPLNTLLPVLKSGAVHPEPYYITQNVVFKVSDRTPPWYAASKATERTLRDMWISSDTFQDTFINEFIKDCLHMEVAGIVSGSIAEKNASDQEEAHIYRYLEDDVVTDVVYVLTAEIVWEGLWDQARKLKKREIDDLEKDYGKRHGDSHMLNVLRQNYTQPLDPEVGESIVNNKWNDLLYHTNRYMQRGSLMENYAIRKLQEQIICQVAAKVLLDEMIKSVESEMTKLDEEDRIDHPPRKVEDDS